MAVERVKHCSSAEENIYQGKSRHGETHWEFVKDSHPTPEGRRESAVLCCVQLEITGRELSEHFCSAASGEGWSSDSGTFRGL